MAPLSLQFHHVPLYLEWAPIGVFGAAPQKKDSQPAQTAEKDKAEPETGKSRVWGHHAVGSRGKRVRAAETVIRPLATSMPCILPAERSPRSIKCPLKSEPHEVTNFQPLGGGL